MHTEQDASEEHIQIQRPTNTGLLLWAGLWVSVGKESKRESVHKSVHTHTQGTLHGGEGFIKASDCEVKKKERKKLVHVLPSFIFCI